MGKVYLITDGEFFKIGVTKGDVEKRIKGLQTGSPNEITLVNYYESNNYRKVESWFHRKYKTKRMEGEWFYLDIEDVESFIVEAKKIDGSIKVLKDNPFF